MKNQNVQEDREIDIKEEDKKKSFGEDLKWAQYKSSM